MAFTGSARDRSRTSDPSECADIVGIISPYETHLLDALGDPQHSAAPTALSQRFSVDFEATRRADTDIPLCAEYDYQLQEHIRQLIRDLENAVINARGAAGMLGLCKQIPEVEIGEAFFRSDFPVSRAIDEVHLLCAHLTVCERSSHCPDLIVVNGPQKRRLNDILNGGGRAAVYESSMGVSRIVLSRWMPPDSVMFLRRESIRLEPVSGKHIAHSIRSDSADTRCGSVHAEFVLHVDHPERCLLLRGLDH